ncbi:MAG TPA: hypothetical protein VIX91_16710 [Candidatus Acidoferrum sp.]
MSEPLTKSVAQQQQQKIETRTAVERIGGFTIVATAVPDLLTSSAFLGTTNLF